MAGWTAVSDCDDWQADGGIVAHRSERFQCHVAALHGPFVVLFQQQSADQANDGRLVGEDADDVTAPLDLAVEAFERVGAVDLAAMWRREPFVAIPPAARAEPLAIPPI